MVALSDRRDEQAEKRQSHKESERESTGIGSQK